MRLWRVSNHANLTGEGGRIVSGRWHTRGQPLVYLAEHPALALVENLVHLEIDTADLPDSYLLLEIDAPDEIASDEITVGELQRRNANWRSEPDFTRPRGDEWLNAWLRGNQTALLRVPSVILPKSTNVLLNPAHSDSKRIRIVDTTRPSYDPRLFGGAGKA